MDQNELRASIKSLELGNDIGLTTFAVGKVNKHLRLRKFDVMELKPRRNVGVEQFQEILEELSQELLEALVVAHSVSSHKREDEKK